MPIPGFRRQPKADDGFIWHDNPKPVTPFRTAEAEQKKLDTIPLPRINNRIVFYRGGRRYTGMYLQSTMTSAASWMIVVDRGGQQSISVYEITKWAYQDGSRDGIENKSR